MSTPDPTSTGAQVAGPGSVIADRYRLDAELGRGGMGVVFRGHDLLLDRPVAVKVLSPSALGTEGRERLLREAQAAARLNHPNIVSVYDAGAAQGTHFIVMELVAGKSLRECAGLSLPEVLAIARQVCNALEHAHAAGVIHRDLKPENIVITDNQTVKLMDFGLAISRGAARLTTEGTLVGTFSYLAPELLRGDPPSVQSDLYALGVTLYECIAGRHPFTGDTLIAVLAQHLEAPVVPPSTYNAGIPAALDLLILKLLSKRPEERPASAAEVREALARLEEAPPAAAPAEELSMLDRITRGRLVGRGPELALLRRHGRQAQGGRGGLVLISGEPGVGKTRLAREILLYAQLNGATVLQGGCYENEATTPYLPFVEALRTWVHTQSPATLRARLGTTAAELARLAPEIADRIGPLEPNPPLPPLEERLRLFDHVVRWLQALAEDGGLLLFIDDLHWADNGTLALLHYLLHQIRAALDTRAGGSPFVVAAYREVELDRNHPLAAALVEWNRERLAVRVPLGRLSPEDTGAMLSTLLGEASLPQDFVEAIYRETEGNPFFVEEVVKALVEQGEITRAGERWQPKAVAHLAIPQSIKEAIGRRLDRLSPACVDSLHTAAVLGKTFAYRELLAVSAAGEDQLLDALDEAGTTQLVRAEGGDVFAFTHDKIREVLYDELNPIRRRRLHQRIAEGLVTLYGAESAAHVQDFAYHFTQSGDAAQGLRYARLAAERAVEVFALDEALRFYDNARECAETLGQADQLAELYSDMGGVYMGRGMFHVCAETLRRALDLTADPAERTRLKYRIGAALVAAGDEHAEPILQEALGELDAETRPHEVAYTLALLGRSLQYRTRYPEAIETLERARRLAEPDADADVLGDLYAYLAGAYYQLGRYPECMAIARLNIAMGESRGFPHAIAVGYESLAECSLNLARWQDALDFAGRDREIAQRIGSYDRAAWADRARACALWNLGDLATAAATGKSAVALAERAGNERLMVLALSELARIESDLGEDEPAVADAERCTALAERLGQAQMRAWSYPALAHHYRQHEQWDLLEELLARQADALGLDGENRRRYTSDPELLLARGRLAEAADAVARTLARPISPQTRAVQRRIQGQILAAQERWDEADAVLAEVVDVLERQGARLELGRAFFERARMRRARGDASGARADAARAHVLFTEAGAGHDLSRLHAWSG